MKLDQGLSFWSEFKKLKLYLVLKTTYHQIEEAQLFLVASSLAYTTILSIIPVLAVSFAVFQAFGGMSRVYETIEPLILSNLTEGTSREAIEIIRTFIKNTHAQVIGIGGMVGLIFTSMSMLYSVEKAINQVWRARVDRKIFHRIASYWLFITFGPLALSIAVGLTSSMQQPFWSIFPQGSGLFLMGTSILFSIYKWVPVTRVKWTCALTAAVVTAALWALARLSYGFYTSRVLTYHKIYGSLGAIPILLLWVYILWVITLAGAALTLALQKHSVT